MRLERNISVRAFVIDNKEGRDFKSEGKGIERQTKLLSGNANFISTILCYKNEVSLMTSSKPYTAILIKNEEVYNLIKSMFDLLWVNIND